MSREVFKDSILVFGDSRGRVWQPQQAEQQAFLFWEILVDFNDNLHLLCDFISLTYLVVVL